MPLTARSARRRTGLAVVVAVALAGAAAPAAGAAEPAPKIADQVSAAPGGERLSGKQARALERLAGRAAKSSGKRAKGRKQAARIRERYVSFCEFNMYGSGTDAYNFIGYVYDDSSILCAWDNDIYVAGRLFVGGQMYMLDMNPHYFVGLLEQYPGWLTPQYSWLAG